LPEDELNAPAAPRSRAAREKEIAMFGMLESLTKAALGVVTVPVAVVADVVTLGGALTDKDQPYTADAVSDVVQNLEDAAKPKDE
jgi:hypothetical protein